MQQRRSQKTFATENLDHQAFRGLQNLFAEAVTLDDDGPVDESLVVGRIQAM